MKMLGIHTVRILVVFYIRALVLRIEEGLWNIILNIKLTSSFLGAMMLSVLEQIYISRIHKSTSICLIHSNWLS